jgi:hypothetical protein
MGRASGSCRLTRRLAPSGVRPATRWRVRAAICRVASSPASSSIARRPRQPPSSPPPDLPTPRARPPDIGTTPARPCTVPRPARAPGHPDPKHHHPRPSHLRQDHRPDPHPAARLRTHRRPHPADPEVVGANHPHEQNRRSTGTTLVKITKVRASGKTTPRALLADAALAVVRQPWGESARSLWSVNSTPWACPGLTGVAGVEFTAATRRKRTFTAATRRKRTFTAATRQHPTGCRAGRLGCLQEPPTPNPRVPTRPHGGLRLRHTGARGHNFLSTP